MDWQWIAVIGLGVVLIVGVGFTSAMRQIIKTESPGKVDEARSILENRYALGELDDEEFAHRLQVLNDERKRNRQRKHQPLD